MTTIRDNNITRFTSRNTAPVRVSPNEIARSILDQRRTRFLFNIPPQRLTPSSPYGAFTETQLDMRRKCEILQHRFGSGGTKGGAPTKRQTWAAIATQRGTQISQRALAALASAGEAVARDDTVPTLSSACDVPGPLITLTLDPAVPLYNYAATSATARTYTTDMTQDASVWRLFTKNEADFLVTRDFCMYIDETAGTQTRTEQAGTILMTNNVTTDTINFSLSVPIALWFTGVAHSPYDPPSDYNAVWYEAYRNNSYVFNMHVASVTPEIYFNDSLVTPPGAPTTTFSAVDLSFNVAGADRQFYGFQYVGMVNISNLVLQSQPGYVYTVKLTVKYTYDINLASYFRTLQTGVFPNVNAANQSYNTNCVINTPTPSGYSAGSFALYPQEHEYVHTPPPESYIV
jgi:hypothetical protein